MLRPKHGNGEDVLRHVEFSGAFFVSAELHDKVLVASLTLADGGTKAQLVGSIDFTECYDSNEIRRTINKTCMSSLGRRNSLEIVV